MAQLAKIPQRRQKAVSYQMAVAVRIQTLLKEKGWTQKRLAAEIGVSPVAISHWLTGLHNLSLATIAKISVALGEEVIVIPNLPTQEAVCEESPCKTNNVLPFQPAAMEATYTKLN